MEQLTEKNSTVLTQIKAKVDEAVDLERKIDRLDEVIRFLGNDVGFLDIRVNYKSDSEMSIGQILGPKFVHAYLSEVIQAEIINIREGLVREFNNLKF